MTIHHTKHHNTYVTNLKASLEKLDSAMTSGDVSGIIGLQGALKFNGGGHINHTLFWENLCPEKKSPTGALETAINESFGSFDAMKSEMSAKSIGTCESFRCVLFFLLCLYGRSLCSVAVF